MLEGDDPGAVIIIEFTSRERAQAWYDSDVYQAILPLRAESSRSTILVVDAVDEDHRATDVLAPA